MTVDRGAARGKAAGVAVAVPVRDEADHLPRLLHALAAQREAPAFSLCLFFDNCRDDSAGIAASLADALPYRIEIDRCDAGPVPNAGRARARAMALAAEAAPDGILVSTDADCEPAPDWLAANLVALADADIVAGRIVRMPEPPSAKQDRIERYLDRLHRVRRTIDPVGWDDDRNHHWTSCASLALRTVTYRALGGFAPLASGEDAALCDAAARAGYHVRRDARVVVHTSARRGGRAERGLAATLAALDRSNAQPLTAHPEDEAWRFRMHCDARLSHGSGAYGRLSRRLGLSRAEVEQVAGECRNGEAFAARIVGDPPGGMRMVELRVAEALLAAFEQADADAVA